MISSLKQAAKHEAYIYIYIYIPVISREYNTMLEKEERVGVQGMEETTDPVGAVVGEPGNQGKREGSRSTAAAVAAGVVALSMLRDKYRRD